MKKLILLLFIPLVSFGQTGMARQSGQTAKEYFESGREKYKNEDYYGAIADYTKAIEIDLNYASAYALRGDPKRKLKDYYGAIADYTKAIEIDPNYDYAYAFRGVAKEELGDLNGACADWKEAAKLGYDEAVKWVSDQCN